MSPSTGSPRTVWVQDSRHTSWPLLPSQKSNPLCLMPSFLSPQYLKGPARDKRFTKAPLAVHWTTKKQNTGLLSLPIQHSAVGVSDSKWEHVFPHGERLDNSKNLRTMLWSRMKKSPRATLVNLSGSWCQNYQGNISVSWHWLIRTTNLPSLHLQAVCELWHFSEEDFSNL